MASLLSVIFTMAFCLVKISMVGSMNVGDHSEFSINFKTPVENTYDDGNVITESSRNGLDCTKFGRDYDVLRSLPFPVVVNPLTTIDKTFAAMNLTNHITELTIYKEIFIPLNIYCLKNLNSLKIYNSNFYEFGLDDESVRAIPAEIGLLSSLRTLHIYDSPVQRLPTEFGKLGSLNQVFIVNGGLTEIPTAIENLSLLQTLQLSNNKLTSLPSNIGKLRSLTALWLDNNKITSLPSTMSSLTALQRLYLQSNLLTSLPSTISSLPVLTTLDLQSNLFTSIDELNGMRSLQYLYAQNCNIRSIPKNLSGLLNLNMSNNRLADLYDIGGLGVGYPNNWKNFDFSYNQIDFIPPEISKIVLYLQMFSVRHNHLTHLTKEFYGFQNLATIGLDLRENLFPLDELNLIRQTLRTKLPLVKALV